MKIRLIKLIESIQSAKPSESKKVDNAFVLLFNFKMIFMLFLLVLFSMRFMVGVGPVWFRDTASAQNIIDEIKKVGHNPLIINSFDSSGKTGLMRAIGKVDLNLVKAFLQAGADVNVHANDDVGDTALHMACYNGSFGGVNPDRGMVLIIDYLIHFKAHEFNKDIFVTDVSARNKRGETPLHHAAQINILPVRKKVMQWLVERGADINSQDREGTTVLHLAVNNNDIHGVQMLFDTFGAVLNPYIANFGKASTFEGKSKEPPMESLEYARHLGFRDVAKRLEECISRQKKDKQSIYNESMNRNASTDTDRH